MDVLRMEEEGISDRRARRPLGVNLIIAVTALGWISTVGFWIVLYASGQIPAMADMASFWERQYGGLIRGFTVADCLWVTLFSAAIVLGLLKMRLWGWTAAMMINAIWVYTSTYTLVRDMFADVTGGMVFFLLFAAYALIATAYLWRVRALFIHRTIDT